MPLQMLPALPQFIMPDASTDIIGLALTILTLLMGALATSEKARQAAQTVFNFYKFAQLLINSTRDKKKPAPAQAALSNGNGHTNGNGNGNGQSDLLKSVMQTLRSEADARESGDQSIAQRLDSLSERGRRDSDNFYMLYSELSRDSKRHDEDIRLLKLETAKTQSQMVAMFREQGDKLEMILHYVQPPTPTPPGDVIPLDDSNDLEAVG